MIYALGLIAICIAWLLPGHYVPWASMQQDAFAAGGVCLAALAVIVTNREWPIRVPPIATWAALLAAVPMVQWLAGMLPFKLDAVLPAAYLIGFALAVVTGYQLARTSRRFVPSLFSAIVVAAIVSVGIGLVQWLELGPYGFMETISRVERVSGNLRQPNQLASLLGMGIVGVMWAFERRFIGATGTLLTVAFLAVGLVLTQSRVAWLFAPMFILAWAAFRVRLSLHTTPLSVTASLVLFGLAVLTWITFAPGPTSGAFLDSMRARTLSGYRLLHWETLCDALTRAPWVGYGWMQVTRAQQAATLDHRPSFEFLGSSHNQLIDLLIWNGIPIGLLVIGAVCWWTSLRVRHCDDIDSWALLLALFLLLAHSMVEFPLQYAYFLLPAGLMVGAIEARASKTAALWPNWQVRRSTYALACAVMAALLAWIVVEYVELEESVRRLRLKEAGYVQPGVEPSVPDIVLLDWQREYVRLFLTEPREKMSDAQIESMRRIVQRYPSPSALMRYARAAALNGRAGEALWALRTMCHISLERHCDQGREHWAEMAKVNPQLNDVSYPPTPVR